MSWCEESDTTGAAGLLGEGPLGTFAGGRLCYLTGSGGTAPTATALSSEATVLGDC